MAEIRESHRTFVWSVEHRQRNYSVAAGREKKHSINSRNEGKFFSTFEGQHRKLAFYRLDNNK